MKLIYNDATEIAVQQVEPYGDYLRILVIGTTPEQLRALFTDSVRTSRMIVQERGQTIATYDGYTSYQWTELRPGKIYGVVIYKPEKTPEAQSAMVQAAVAVAQIQAQNLTDEQALTVKALYKNWEDDPEGYPYKESDPDDKRRNYNGKLWNLNKDHDKQADWYPGADPTLWTEIVEGYAGTFEDPIPVPDSVTTSGFEYEYGKYYREGGVVYLCKRGGVSNPEGMYGQKEKLFFSPSALLNQYFVLAE